MRYLLILAGVCGVLGAILVSYASTIPVYSDSEAPWKLADKLQPLPREERFEQWYSELKVYETPHKRLSDLGRGLLAFAFATACSAALWFAYHRYRIMRRSLPLLLIWIALWALRIPLSSWYYEVRFRRSDFPHWGDSIGIGIYSESITWMLGALVSTAILLLLRIGCSLPDKIRIQKPDTGYSWLRTIFFGLWLALNAAFVASGIPDGDEGMVIGPMVGSIVLLAFWSARIETSSSIAKT